MSRSKRAPVHTQGYGGKARKFLKKLANKCVKNSDVPSGGAYKKTFSSWDICDWKFYDKNPEKPWKVKRK